MSNRCSYAAAWIGAAMGVMAILSGCEKKSTDPSDPKVIERVRAKLVEADAADGATDKVVSKCAGCSLRMDGSDEYALTAHGFTLHFCSEECRDRFHKDLTRAILDLKIPKP
ncbi:MAG: hypothetical protein D6788_04345 [Planctomycetota bacterium]|nr:MAG: hypothetical protein D6788_04345 [Planctomycetota bacterium]